MVPKIVCKLIKLMKTSVLFSIVLLVGNVFIVHCAPSSTAVGNLVEQVKMSSGLELYFAKSPATGILRQWADEIDDPEAPKISYELAVQREVDVVTAIDNGLWPEETYIEYQKLVSTTGNVDSAKLLIKYGVDSIVENTISMNSPTGKFHNSIVYCKGKYSK